LRGHTEKNIKQHKATLEAFAHEAEEWQAYLAWFKTLPLFLELPGLRAVHACWHEAALTALGRTTALGDQLLLQSATRGTREFRAIETLLKGLELQLPNCYSFEDRDGFRRSTIRVKWWLKMAQTTYRHLAYPECTEVPAQPVADAELSELTGYPPDEVPVFFGHYWLPPGQPRIEASNVACLDYSVAKGGSLVAYRWSGEQRLDDANFVAEPADGRLPVSLWKCHDREPE